MNFRDHFDLEPGLIHLNNAGVAPLSAPAREALIKTSTALSRRGFHAVQEMLPLIDEGKSALGKLVGCNPQQIAFTQNFSMAISIVGMGMHLSPGDEILTWDQEYPSNAYIWHAAAAKSGARVVTIASEENRSLNQEKLLAAINKHTKVVAVSWIQSEAGSLTSLRPIVERCREVGAIVVADVIQGLGVLPFDMDALGVDIVCGGTHKWMCGPIGLGFLAIKQDLIPSLDLVLQGAMTYGTPADRTNPLSLPHPDARRFQPGALPFSQIAAATASINTLLGSDVAKIAAHAMDLRTRLVEKLLQMGMGVCGALNPEESGPLVTFDPGDAHHKVAQALEKAGISISHRFDRIRLSPHGFNTRDEIDLALKIIERSIL